MARVLDWHSAMMMKTVSFGLFVLVVAAACGGEVGGSPDAGVCPANPTGTCSNEGAQCQFNAEICGSPGTQTCTCSGGSWSCPDYKCPFEGCPVSYMPDMTCHTAGLNCQIPANFCGGSGSVECTCNGSQFDCILPNCPAVPCPVPSTIFEGQSCDLPMGTQCTADVCGQPTQCTCSANQWWCNSGPGGDCDAGAPDTGADF